MADILSIKIPKPICSIAVSEDAGDRIKVTNFAAEYEALKLKQNKINSLSQALESALQELERFREDVVAQAKHQIASLSVEIASLIVSEKIDANKYDIEKIIIDTLACSSEKSDVQIHLNPFDFSVVKELIEKNQQTQISVFKFISDTTVSKAGCKIDSGKGIVESSAQSRLEGIAAALKAAMN